MAQINLLSRFINSLRQLTVRQTSRVAPRPDSFLVRMQTEQGPETPPPIPYDKAQDDKKKTCCNVQIWSNKLKVNLRKLMTIDLTRLKKAKRIIVVTLCVDNTLKVIP